MQLRFLDEPAFFLGVASSGPGPPKKPLGIIKAGFYQLTPVAQPTLSKHRSGMDFNWPLD